MDLGSLIGAALQQGMGGRNPGAARLQQGAQSVGGAGGGMEDLMAALSGAGGPGGGGAFGDLMGQVMGAAPETKSAVAPTGGLGGLLGQLTGGGGLGGMLSQLTGGATASPAGGAGPDLGAMLGGLLGGGSRAALGGGAMGMLAAVAMQALKSGAGAAAPAPVAPPQARELVDADAEALVLRAMISAAKADGRIDAGEEAALMDKLGADGMDAGEKAFVEAELRTPVDVAALAAQARNPAQAAQVYAASLLAIEVDTEQERAYLRALADALGLSPAQAAAIHQATGAPSV